MKFVCFAKLRMSREVIFFSNVTTRLKFGSMLLKVFQEAPTQSTGLKYCLLLQIRKGRRRAYSAFDMLFRRFYTPFGKSVIRSHMVIK